MTRLLPLVNMGTWAIQCVLSMTYAHSWQLATLGAVGVLMAYAQYRNEASR